MLILTFNYISLHLFLGSSCSGNVDLHRLMKTSRNLWNRTAICWWYAIAFLFQTDPDFCDWSHMFCSLLTKVNPITYFIIRLFGTVLSLSIVSWFVMFPLHSHSLDSFESYSGNTHLLDVLTSTSFSHYWSLLICLNVGVPLAWLPLHAESGHQLQEL